MRRATQMQIIPLSKSNSWTLTVLTKTNRILIIASMMCQAFKICLCLWAFQELNRITAIITVILKWGINKKNIIGKLMQGNWWRFHRNVIGW
jgi:hypothetical protein